MSVANIHLYVCLGQYMPRVGSRQASLNYLIWFTLLCYLLCSGDKIRRFQRIAFNLFHTYLSHPPFLVHNCEYVIGDYLPIDGLS